MSWGVIHLPLCTLPHTHTHTHTAMLTSWAREGLPCWGLGSKEGSGIEAEEKELERARDRVRERVLESVNIHHQSKWLRRWHTETSPDPCRQIALVNDFSYQLNHTIHPSLPPSFHLSLCINHPSLSLSLSPMSFPHWVYFPLAQWSAMADVWWTPAPFTHEAYVWCTHSLSLSLSLWLSSP